MIKRERSFFLQMFLLGSLFVQMSLSSQKSPAGVMIGNTWHSAETFAHDWNLCRRVPPGGVVEMFVQKILGDDSIDVWYNSVELSLQTPAAVAVLRIDGLETDGKNICISRFSGLFGLNSIENLCKKTEFSSFLHLLNKGTLPENGQCKYNNQLYTWASVLFHENGHIKSDDAWTKKISEILIILMTVIMFLILLILIRISKIKSFITSYKWLHLLFVWTIFMVNFLGAMLGAMFLINVFSQYREFKADDSIPNKTEFLRSSSVRWMDDRGRCNAEKVNEIAKACIGKSPYLRVKLSISNQLTVLINKTENLRSIFCTHPTYQERKDRFNQRLFLLENNKSDSEIKSEMESIDAWKKYSWKKYPLYKYFIAREIEKVVSIVKNSFEKLKGVKRKMSNSSLVTKADSRFYPSP